MAFKEDFNDGVTLSKIAVCNSHLLALHTEFSTSLDRIATRTAVPYGERFALFNAHHLQQMLARETQDNQTFMDLMRIAEILEGDRKRLLNEKHALTEENMSLKDEVSRLQRKMVVCEETIEQLQSEKQQLQFMNDLHTLENEAMDGRISVISSKDMFAQTPEVKSSYGFSPSARSLLNHSGGHRQRRFLRESEDRSPLAVSKSAVGRSVGNFTMCMGETAIEVDELDELTDKLGWYESIMRQLQGIFETELDDPDVTYHEESTKIVERAKRMVEYRAMVHDYEKTIHELQKSNAQMHAEREELRKKADSDQRRRDRILADSTTKNLNQLSTSCSGSIPVKYKSSR
ncbi:hypothetical protein BV898_01458 [Hypsibius exemplaris]|uniref:Uncharacterized protein n=1 Tax=Hypsibius exemplaris TaxID=2072580 RepID=A0A1W0XC13_HYPEX|nr:hypothetical protein BV898_01458 [Hypsibius exemplaris]